MRTVSHVALQSFEHCRAPPPLPVQLQLTLPALPSQQPHHLRQDVLGKPIGSAEVRGPDQEPVRAEAAKSGVGRGIEVVELLQLSPLPQHPLRSFPALVSAQGGDAGRTISGGSVGWLCGMESSGLFRIGEAKHFHRTQHTVVIRQLAETEFPPRRGKAAGIP